MILDRIKSTIRKYGLIGKNDKIVIGVSGGPDSTALLYLLNSLKKDFKLSLYIAHLDHMLRSGSSGDEEFVQNLGGKLKIPVISTKIDVKKISGYGSLEETARNARFSFFFKVAKSVKASKIALGHNLDDQAETVLMRIIRGTGLYGLAAILPKRKMAGLEIIRPLIEVKRKDIELFLKQKKIKPRIDITNSQDIYLRNKIRNKFLPLLEKTYNRKIKDVLSNLAESAGYDYDYLNQAALRVARRTNYRLSLKELLRMHPAVRRMLFRLKIAELKGDTRRITFQHVLEIEDMIFYRPVNSIVDLPKGISVTKKKTSLLFYKR